MTDWEWFCKELERTGAKVTFSRNCCSGIVFALKDGTRCQCWRCREERGEPHDEISEALAKDISLRAQRAMREVINQRYHDADQPSAH